VRAISQIVLMVGLITTTESGNAVAGDAPLPRTAGRWNRHDTVAVFNDQQLFDLIDGGASLFFEYGFVRAHSAEYGDSTGRVLGVELYEMSDPASAFGIFSSLAAGIGTEVQPGLRMSMGEGFGFLWKGSVMGSMTLLQGPAIVEKDLAALSTCIGGLLRENGPPPALVNRLLDAGCDADGMVLFEGKLGLLNHSPFRGVQSIPVETGVTGTKRGCPFVVFSYADSARSLSAYRVWVKEMLADSSAVIHQGERNTRIRFGNDEVLTISLTAAHIVGVRGVDATDIIHAVTQR
jgi:hypothetical protein